MNLGREAKSIVLVKGIVLGLWVQGSAGWLNTHNKGEWNSETRTASTGGYKIYFLDDPAIGEALSGEKDHFVTNAQAPIPGIWMSGLQWLAGWEESTNDLAYNVLGAQFGSGVFRPPIYERIEKDKVEEWIIEHLHGPEEVAIP